MKRSFPSEWKRSAHILHGRSCDSVFLRIAIECGNAWEALKGLVSQL